LLLRKDLLHRSTSYASRFRRCASGARIPDCCGISGGRRAGARVEPKLLTSPAETALVTFDWPGNVRQLVNACRRLTVTAPGREIRAEDIPPDLGGAQAGQLSSHIGWQSFRIGRAGIGRSTSGCSSCGARSRAHLDPRRAAQGRRLKQDAAKLLGWGRNTLTAR